MPFNLQKVIDNNPELFKACARNAMGYFVEQERNLIRFVYSDYIASYKVHGESMDDLPTIATAIFNDFCATPEKFAMWLDLDRVLGSTRSSKARRDE